MARLLHTSDWRIGAIPVGCPPRIAARMRDRRVDAIRHIAAAAVDHKVDAVVVCGNTLADLTLGSATLTSLAKALDRFTCPVVLIPGELDAAAPFGAWAHLKTLRSADATWHIADGSPFAVADITLLPVPRRRRGSVDDHTLGLSMDHPQPVVATHGGCRGGPHADDSAHRVDVDALLERGAVGVLLGGRAVPETHEAASWPGSPQPLAPDTVTGSVRIVDTAGDSTTVELPHLRWLTWNREATLAVIEELSELEPAQDHVVQLTLSGRTTPRALHQLLAKLNDALPALMHLEWTLDDVQLDHDDTLPQALGQAQRTLLTDGSANARRAALLLADLLESP